MANPVASTLQDVTPPGNLMKGYPFEDIPDNVAEVGDVTGGMVTSLPRTQIPGKSFLSVKNARTRHDWVGRRPGTSEFIAKPDSNVVLGLILHFDESNDATLVRLTPDTAHIAKNPDQWISVSYPFSKNEWKARAARILGDTYFTTGGSNKLAKIDTTTNTISEVSEAPAGRYLTSFAERAIVADINETTGRAPFKIQWSANSDPTDWTGLSAGEENLVQAPSDFVDYISGIFGLTNEMVILRRRTIWHATRQPFAQAPFRFTSVIAGLGCDLPYTAIQAEDFVIYADQRTRGVYIYQPGSRPQKISGPIERDLFEDLDNLSWAEATYDPFEREYHLGLSTTVGSTRITKTWVFSLRSRAWSYDDGPEISTLAIVAEPPEGTPIDSLLGTINDLVGTIDDQGGEAVPTPTLFKGTDTGEVLIQSFADDTDYDLTAFEFEVISQDLGSLSRRREMKDLVAAIESSVAGNVTVENSIDAATWLNTETLTLLAAAGRQSVGLKKQSVTGDELYWRLRSTSSDVKLRSWFVRLLNKGTKR